METENVTTLIALRGTISELPDALQMRSSLKEELQKSLAPHPRKIGTAQQSNANQI